MTTLFRVKALYEYSSPHEDDLNFPSGQIIAVTEEEDDEWYGGEYMDDNGEKQQGIFPRNFVEKFEPTAPPRPTRTRPKKGDEATPATAAAVEAAATHQDEPETAAVSDPVAEEAAPKSPPEPQPFEESQQTEKPHRQSTVQPPAPSTPAAKQAVAPQTNPSALPDPAEAPIPSTKPKGPPPVSEKPSSNSFKDRIAAFNKPAAAPVAPFKPSGLSNAGNSGSSGGFIKKPFVAPPPSRNAYVPSVPKDAPVTKTYRRDEDPEIKEREAETQAQAEKAGLIPAVTSPSETTAIAEEGDAEEDQPKPTSLKDRIALLQKQQMEQAQRHADAATKKEKPKKPPPKRNETTDSLEPEAEASEPRISATLERSETGDGGMRTSTDEAERPPIPSQPRRRSSRGPGAAHPPLDGNEADVSGAGDTTEGHDDDTTERDDDDELSTSLPRAATGSTTRSVPPPPVRRQTTGDSTVVRQPAGSGKEHTVEEEPQHSEDEEEEDEEEEEDVDPEVRRKEELRARMAKISGGMGFPGMFGAPMPPAPAQKKKKASRPAEVPEEDDDRDNEASQRAPPVPTMIALPGMSGARKPENAPPAEDTGAQPITRAPPPPVPARSTEAQSIEHDDDASSEDEDAPTPGPTPALSDSRAARGGPPPVPGERPGPLSVPSEGRPPPPPSRPAEANRTLTEGSESDDELSGPGRDRQLESRGPPPLKSPPMPPASPGASSPAQSPYGEEPTPMIPLSTGSKRQSRPPPPVPGAAPAPPPSSTRPPPPPPPHGTVSRQSTGDVAVPSHPPQAGETDGEEHTEYEGDYDTDIASSAPHRDALKARTKRDSTDEERLRSPAEESIARLPPPIPTSPAPRGGGSGPPPLPAQPPPPPSATSESKRRSMDFPRAAPPPPPARDLENDETPDAHGYASPRAGGRSSYSQKAPMIEEEAYFPAQPTAAPAASRQSMSERRVPATTPGRGPRQSLDVQRAATGGTSRRSVDVTRPSMESGFIANDVDLAVQSGWWKQSNQVPPVFQGRKDVYFECEESTTTNGGSKTVVSREVSVLFQDYSQTYISVHYDPYDPADVEVDQRHEAPPRPLRQDQMEEYYERFGRPIADAVASKKDSVVADGSSQGLVLELLRPFRDALMPVGTRGYGALVYSNMANASTQQNDVIRPGDIITIRNAKFQGKHGAMHAKYSMEVGKPDHVAVVSEWDGTKKKVRAWEQGRESKKVKVESFKLDDLRSGEVKIWRVMPRSWLGWNTAS